MNTVDFREQARRKGWTCWSKLQFSLSVTLLFACGFPHQLLLKPSCLICYLPFLQVPGLEALLGRGRSIVFLETSERMEPTPLVCCAVESAAKVYPERKSLCCCLSKGSQFTEAAVPQTHFPWSPFFSLSNWHVFLSSLDMKSLFEDTPLFSWYTE